MFPGIKVVLFATSLLIKPNVPILPVNGLVDVFMFHILPISILRTLYL